MPTEIQTRLFYPSELEVGSREWAEDLRVKAVALKRDLDRGFLELGRILYTFYDVPVGNDPINEPVCTYWGYKNVEQFAWNELGIQPRKCRFLRKIFYTMEVELADVDPELKDAVLSLGYSKVRELVGVLTPYNIEAWAERGRDCKYEELSRAIQKYRAMCKAAEEDAQQAAKEEGGSDVEHYIEPEVAEVDEAHWERFCLFDDQKAMVDYALQCASTIAKSEKKGHLLTLICMDYLATNGATPPGTDEFKAYVANLERLLGVRMVVFERVAGQFDVLYGAQTLQDVAHSMEDDDDERDDNRREGHLSGSA